MTGEYGFPVPSRGARGAGERRSVKQSVEAAQILKGPIRHVPVCSVAYMHQAMVYNSCNM